MTATTHPHDPDCDSITCCSPRNYAVGDCHELATAISLTTGWDYAIFDGAGAHVTVVTPSGGYLDITGIRSENDIRAQWHADQPTITDSIWSHGWDAYPCVCDYRIAKIVLRDAGLLDEELELLIDEKIDDIVG